ncbi:peptide chain release factor N(5)-glutamine methyltransferase [Candidatus Saccharibacteria bacterium]|nr:peptide chain release factor N(5)-glutamine methyltransferase [Candidatus Saccharibacteria bacterium]
MNVSSWLKQAKTRIDSLDAELILLDVLGKRERSFLVAHDDMGISRYEKELERRVLRREKGEPLAYIVGRKEFFGREFLVSPEVLIPRPESEAMVEIVKKLKVRRILDVGTGSGCLAVSLKLEKPEAEVVGVDISAGALGVAKKNAEKLGAKVQFLQSDLLEKVEGDFDVIVANLPYVDRDWEFISGIEFEPESALFAEDGGLFLIKKLILEAKKRTKYLVLEADPCQHEKIVDFARTNGFEFAEKSGFVLLLVSAESDV